MVKTCTNRILFIALRFSEWFFNKLNACQVSNCANAYTLTQSFIFCFIEGAWQPLDCYNNVSPRDDFALPESFDNNVDSVTGPDAIFDYCKGKAEAFDYKVFGADDKSCWSGGDAEKTYNKYGESKLCDFSKKTGHGSGQDKNGDVFVYKLA